MPSSRTTTVFTDASAAAAGVSSSQADAASALCGIVTLSPPSPSVDAARTASAPRPGATSSATYTQSSPAAANAALWIAGDREWRTGRADDRGEPRRPGDHLITPRRRASAMFAWCCA